MLIRLITSDPTEVASAGEKLLHYCNPIQTEHFGFCGFAASGGPDHKRTCLRFCAMSALPADERTSLGTLDMSEKCRLCCKSLFASLNANFPGRTRGDQTLIWGTTLSSDELTGDFGNGLEATSI